MKRIIFLLLLSCFMVAAEGQIFNSSRAIGRGRFYLGLEPAVYAKSGTDVYMFFHGGAGITNQIDLALTAGVGPSTYFGTSLQWALANRVQLITGARYFDYFGLNGGLTYSIPLVKGTHLWLGSNMVLEFADEVRVPLWIPLGVEIGFRDNITFLLESEIGLTSPAPHIISGGLAIYFR
jgi:hypothetical protein